MPKNVNRSPRGSIRQPLVFNGTDWAEVARRIRAASSNLSKADQDFLTDLARGQRHGSARELDRVVDLSIRCTTDAGAFAVVEIVRARIAARRAQHRLDLAEALREEARAEHREELATLACLTRQSDASARTELREASYALSCAANLVHDAVAQ